MNSWHVFRRGSNAANQPMCRLAYLGTVEAYTHEHASVKALDQFEYYNNQFIEVYKDTGSWRGLPKGYWAVICDDETEVGI